MRLTMARLFVVAAALCVAASQAQNLELPKLPYEYKDLEPFIDHTTMHIHHMVVKVYSCSQDFCVCMLAAMHIHHM